MTGASARAAGAEAALPPTRVQQREVALQAVLQQNELDALIVTAPANIRWLTGFAGSNATVAVVEGELTLFTDSRYADRAPVELAAAGSTASVVIARADLPEAVRDALEHVETVGLEADHLSYNRFRQITDDWLPKQTTVPTSEMVETLRACKDAAEIARIEAAAHIVDVALGQVRSALVARPTEREFARLLDAAIRSGGADDLGFDTIVASGPNAAIPHHSPVDRTVEAGDLVIVDVGAMVDGYRSDMTRTFCVGRFTADQRRHYETVAAAQQAGVEAMVAGAETGEVDAAARAVIDEAGWAANFTHGTGHGVGLDIHELPRVAAAAPARYALGTVATVEPGVYLPGVGGVRVEDTCVVTEFGARRLTTFPKDPEIV